MTVEDPSGPDAGRQRRERAEQLFEEARALAPEMRPAFIASACGDDDRLRADLDSLLDHAAAAEAFFERLTEVAIPREFVPSPVVGRYRILGFLGAGGMGAVYRAHDLTLDRDVALKFLPAHASPALDVERRLLIEARAAAALEHPNVCTLHEIGETEDGRPFIAMAFYEGETLKERLDRGRLPVAEAIDIAAQVARGLGAAHARGIVHRDVKPGNIMLTADGTVKLLDFGLAKFADASLTRPGSTPGTIAYMAPEQVRGDPAGPRSDLWSLGVVLYEMLAGTRPFRGGNDRALMQAILHDSAEPLHRWTPEAPRPVERIAARLLEKDPDRRYAAAHEVISALSTAKAASAGAPHARRWPGLPRPAMRYALAAGLALAVAGSVLWMGGRGSARAAAEAGAARTIAVLPFTDLSRDAQDDGFSDGLTEELIGALSRVSALRVAARTSAFAFKDQPHDIREIGGALNVGAIVEGSVRRRGDRVRVEARLINVADGLHLWSEVYERELTDIFDIQRDLALSIAGALRAEMTPAERDRLARPATGSAEAFVLYSRGRHFWHQRTPAGYQRAVEYFQRAIAADSQYAAPYAGLAAVYSLQALSGAVHADEARERAITAVRRALALDDGLAEAHAVYGLYLHAFEWDARGAEREFVRAIELDPSYPTARVYFGNLLAALGRLEESVAHKRRAVDLDPLAPSLSESLAFTLLRARRLEEAFQHVNAAIELDSTYWRGRAVLGLYYELSGRFDDALREYALANRLAGSAVHRTKADIARVLARIGRAVEAGALVTELDAEAAAMGVWEPAVATAYMALGDVDAAVAWLEQALARRHPHLPFTAGDPRFADLFGEPRFTALMRKVGM